MGKFIQAILRWFDALIKAFTDILHEGQDKSHEQVAGGTGIEEARRAAAKPGELVMGSDERPVYQKSRSLLSFREKELYSAICDATHGEYTVLMKVRMGDFVWLRNEPQDRKFFKNQVLCKHVDFLLCDKNSLKPLLVIELDDSSHIKDGYTIDSDRFKEETFREIGMPMLRIKLQRTYNIEKLSGQISTILHNAREVKA